MDERSSAALGAGRFRSAVGVVAAGRFGVTLAELAARNGNDVVLFTSLPRRASALQKNRRLPSVVPELRALHERVTVTRDPRVLAERCTLITVTASSEYFDPLLEQLGDVLDGAHQVVHAVHRLRGPRLQRVTEVLRTRTAVKQVGVIAGPMHVSEILSGQPNAAVVGSSFPDLIARVQAAYASDSVRVYGDDDNRGVEFAAALGQVVALGVGMADGLELGAATHSTLLTRGLAEMTQVGVELGANASTFQGLAGVGRLVDALRRGEPNYQTGFEIARANDVAAVVANAPPETLGLDVLRHLAAYADYHRATLPLTSALRAVVSGECTPRDGLLEALRTSAELANP
jgi:glycerol-3-phosphate dehydrogenase (NAD(P)+)